MSSLSVVIPSWNTRELLAGCLRSLETTLPHSSEVIVVDNGSTDGSAKMVAQHFPGVRLVRNSRNLGFTVACNQGVSLSRGKYIVLLNSDTLVQGDTLRRMLLFLECNAYYGACVPRLLNVDGSTQRNMQRLPSLWTPLFTGTPLERWFPESVERRRYQALDFDYERVGEVENPPAVCLMIRREALGNDRPLDEKLWLAFSDADLCRRLWTSGWRIAYLPQARLLHFGGASAAQMADFDANWQRNRLEYFRKHHGHFAGLWVKLCMGLAVADHLVRELWRRAHGDQDVSLASVWLEYASFLRH
jgi:GT2 family glycosyltransferase